jgi:penicillin-insensitive murein DD-endopeptidase
MAENLCDLGRMREHVGMPRRSAWGALVLACALLSTAHAGKQPSSYAVGRPWKGKLVGGVCLAARGDGYVRPRTWAERGLCYGTRELVGAIERAARVVHERLPGSLLYVGDMSPRRGGPSQWHRSHQNGLDADLLFYAVDKAGKNASQPAAMRRFDDDLRSGRWRFDTPRNWLLLRALLEDGEVRVARVFVARDMEEELLDYARREREPKWLIARAAQVMQQSGGPHDDHFHLRIACPAGQRAMGCIDQAGGGGGGVARKAKVVKKRQKVTKRRGEKKRRR